MIEGFQIITVTHRHAKLNELEHFVPPVNDDESLKASLQSLKSFFEIEELMYVSTCNRIMFFFYKEHALEADFISRFFKKVNPNLSINTFERLADSIQYMKGDKAMRHLFEVASSIDSMVVGEREILRQVRDAYRQSMAWKLTGDNIRVAMKLTVETAKRVYAKTRIGEKPVSVVSLAIQRLLQTKMPKSARILMIGAGQTNNLVAKFLVKHGFSNVTVFNRTLSRAEKIAGKFDQGNAFQIDDLEQYKEGFDCMIVCTASIRPIINSDNYLKLLSDEKSKKTLIDLAIPNNIDQSLAEVFPVEYIEIEGLRQMADANLDFRRQEIIKAKVLIDVQIKNFIEAHQQRRIERAMRHIPAEIKAIKAHAVNTVFKKELEELDDEARALLDKVLNYMEKRCISVPMKAVKEKKV